MAVPADTAIASLYQVHGPALLRYLDRAFGHCAAPEDLLHETFVEALTTGERCLAAASPRAFLFGIARHVGLTARRRARRRPTVPLQETEPAAPAEDPALADMRQAIGRLPDHLRETLELRLREDLSYDEIAAVLEIPVGTVRSRLHAAVKALRARL